MLLRILILVNFFTITCVYASISYHHDFSEKDKNIYMARTDGDSFPIEFEMTASPQKLNSTLNPDLYQITFKSDFENSSQKKGKGILVGPHHILTTADYVWDNNWAKKATVSVEKEKIQAVKLVSIKKITYKNQNSELVLLLFNKKIRKDGSYANFYKSEKKVEEIKISEINGEYPCKYTKDLILYSEIGNTEIPEEKTFLGLWAKETDPVNNYFLTGIHIGQKSGKKDEAITGIRLTLEVINFLENQINKTFYIPGPEVSANMPTEVKRYDAAHKKLTTLNKRIKECYSLAKFLRPLGSIQEEEQEEEQGTLELARRCAELAAATVLKYTWIAPVNHITSSIEVHEEEKLDIEETELDNIQAKRILIDKHFEDFYKSRKDGKLSFFSFKKHTILPFYPDRKKIISTLQNDNFHVHQGAEEFINNMILFKEKVIRDDLSSAAGVLESYKKIMLKKINKRRQAGHTKDKIATELKITKGLYDCLLTSN